MHQPKLNCVFYTSIGNCAHLSRGKGFLWLGKPCLLYHDFVGSCSKRVEYNAKPNLSYPPPPPCEEILTTENSEEHF